MEQVWEERKTLAWFPMFQIFILSYVSAFFLYKRCRFAPPTFFAPFPSVGRPPSYLTVWIFLRQYSLSRHRSGACCHGAREAVTALSVPRQWNEFHQSNLRAVAERLSYHLLSHQATVDWRNAFRSSWTHSTIHVSEPWEEDCHVIFRILERKLVWETALGERHTMKELSSSASRRISRAGPASEAAPPWRRRVLRKGKFSCGIPAHCTVGSRESTITWDFVPLKSLW